MKLIAILIMMMPIFSFANPATSDFNDRLVNPEAIKAGTTLKSMSKHLTTKTTKLAEGKVAHNLKLTSIGMSNVTLSNAYLVAEKGIITSLSLSFDKKNGEAFLEGIIAKYGMPFGEMIDVYEWKNNNNVIFEIHETATGYQATYKSLDQDLLKQVIIAAKK